MAERCNLTDIGSCDRCPVQDKFVDAINDADNRKRPIQQVRSEVAAGNCPDGLKPEARLIMVDPIHDASGELVSARMVQTFKLADEVMRLKMQKIGDIQASIEVVEIADLVDRADSHIVNFHPHEAAKPLVVNG